MQKEFLKITAIALLILLVNYANADQINWVTDWQIQQQDSLVTGTTVQNGDTINVSYVGRFTQIASASYWSEGDPPPYTGSDIVDNAPTSGITLSSVSTSDSGYANTITFSSPIKDPLMALYSVGSSSRGVPYEFDQSFTLLSEGAGAWGAGRFFISGDTLTGYEGCGVIQFSGMISSISWNNPVSEYHHGFSIGVIDSAVLSINEQNNSVPKGYTLSQNYPNPFNPQTTISFSIARQTFVELTVMDVRGRKIATLVNKNLSAGTYNYKFDASQLSSGVYLYMIKTKEFTKVRKMLLVK